MTLNKQIIDGVPVFWQEGPAPLEAALIFRAGVRDETFATVGITHLVEHVVMGQASDGRDSTNAMVEPSMTTFGTAGKPETVAAFLSAVCAAITAPSLERLSVEKKVLEAEGGAVVNPAISQHLRRRFGLSSLGLTDVAPHALRLMDEDVVRAHIRRFFTRDNAALVLSGPPPEDLQLVLPQGVRQIPQPAPRVDLPYPMWFEQDGAQLGVSFELPLLDDVEAEAALLLCSIIRTRVMADLRHSRGWIYDVEVEPVLDIDNRGVLCVLTDPPPHHVLEVQNELLGVLRSLRDVGPSAEEVAACQRELEDYLGDPRNALDETVAAARNYLMGFPVVSAGEKMELARRVTPATCMRVMSLLDGTLVVGMPEGHAPEDAALTAEHARQYPPISGERFRRGLRGAVMGVPARAQLVVGDDGLSFSDGMYFSMLWEEVEALEEAEPGVVTVTASSGLSVDVSARWFSKGERAIEFIRQNVPAAKVLPPA